MFSRLKRTMASKTIERQLWHGTDEIAIGNISANGFNRNYRGRNGIMQAY